MNALLRKEIRDTVRWLPLGIVLLGLLLAYSCQTIYAPNLSGQLYMATWFSSLLFGSFLSLVTFVPDEREAARAFLIHRAIAPNQIFRTRILVGLAVYFLGMFIPLIVVAVYLAAIGPERLPVSPWQVVPAFLAVIPGSIFYLSGIVIACRPANWFGTRLLPLAAAVGGSFLSISVSAEEPSYLSLPLYALSCGCTLLMAFAARHAFVRMPSRAAPARSSSVSPALPLVLLASSVLIVSAIGLLPINFIGQVYFRYPTTEFDKDGMPIYVVRGSAMNQNGTSEVLELIPMIEPPEPKPERIEVSSFGTPFVMAALGRPNKFDPRFVQQFGHRQIFLDPSGYLLVYQLNQALGSTLECIIASNAISLPNEPRGTPFSRTPRFLTVTPNYPQVNFSFAIPQPPTMQIDSSPRWTMVTSDGIKRVDLEKRTIESLLEQTVDSIGLSVTGGAEQVAFQTRDSIRVYRSDVSQADTQPSKFTLEATLQTTGDANGYLSYRDSENWTYLNGYGRQSNFNVTRCSAGMTRSYTFALPDEMQKSMGRGRSEAPFVFVALPPLLTVSSLAITHTFNDFNTFDYLPLIIQLLVNITLTVAVTRYRGLRSKLAALWLVLAGLLGLGVPLAVLAIYPVAVYEICTACQRRRRVENATCEHCSANWDALPSEGIEIVETRGVEALSPVGQA